jgi:hypothetical protein
VFLVLICFGLSCHVLKFRFFNVVYFFHLKTAFLLLHVFLYAVLCEVFLSSFSKGQFLMSVFDEYL